MYSPSKSFYASSVSSFLDSSIESVVGTLATKVSLLHIGDERQQIKSWEKQVQLLQSVISSLEISHDGWGVLLELQLLRLNRRIDCVLLIGGNILCIEFKIGSKDFLSSDLNQTVDYALCLRDFHSGSKDRPIFPILCCDEGPTICPSTFDLTCLELVSACAKTNTQTLESTILRICDRSSQLDEEQIDYRWFDASSYNPTPNIVNAAKGIYAGHTVKEIGRSDANGDSLQNTSKLLGEIANNAKSEKKHTICFVTGEPGAGKTLLGLDLVFSGQAGRVAGEPAALLSGNRPLVAVLQEAIAEDAKQRDKITKSEAKRQATQALQNLLGYLKEHSAEDSVPPEHVIVFDEAQRAWDAETGKKLLDRNASEPELFLEILSKLDWCCLVCLVGSGQEINRGEGGLQLWGAALEKFNKTQRWDIFISPQSLSGKRGLIKTVDNSSIKVQLNSDLHLVTNLRAYRNDKQGLWVEALLEGDVSFASDIANEMEHSPAFVTRNLTNAKSWLRMRNRGGHRVGLLASSGAVRLIAEGVPFSPRSNELDEVAHWFLKPTGDYRSSNALEKPLSEFVCQGLEIDYACLCWGNDLIWKENAWLVRKMSAPKWQTAKKPETIQFRLNAYRVLLTRSRAGLVIYIPEGENGDFTRNSEDFDSVYTILLKAGCISID